MEKLIILVVTLVAFQLTGCSTPMMKKENNNKVVNFYLVKLTNDKKITDKVINLSFDVNPKSNLGEFDFQEFKEDVTAGLKSKGIQLSPEGRKVNVTIDYLHAWGNNLGAQRSYGTGVAAGLADAAGLGVAARVVGDAAENSVTNSARDNQNVVCEDSNCAAEIGISISSNDYNTSFSLRDTRIAYGYLRRAESFAESSVQEFFEPSK